MRGSKKKLLFLQACDTEQHLAKHNNSLGLVGVQAGDWHHFDLRSPWCLQQIGSTGFTKLVWGSVVLRSSRTFQKPQESIKNFSLADKRRVKTNSWCKVRQNFTLWGGGKVTLNTGLALWAPLTELCGHNRTAESSLNCFCSRLRVFSRLQTAAEETLSDL